MPNLTPEGLRAVSDAAARHGFSADAALNLVDSLICGQGNQAQFNHPEFGGLGQWSHGGMIMIGDMFNHGLKYRVDALCNELSGLLGQQASIHAPVEGSRSQTQGDGDSLFLGGTSQWWPPELGQPSSSGSQNDMRYAFFPAAQRLAIRQGNRIQIYDSGDHRFSGFSQQQGGGQSLTFNSQHGTVRVSDLPLVSEENESRESASTKSNPDVPAPAAPQPKAQNARNSTLLQPPPRESSHSPAPVIRGAALVAEDIFKVIKELATLRQEGILTDEEFATKKAELLGRI